MSERFIRSPRNDGQIVRGISQHRVFPIDDDRSLTGVEQDTRTAISAIPPHWHKTCNVPAHKGLRAIRRSYTVREPQEIAVNSTRSGAHLFALLSLGALIACSGSSSPPGSSGGGGGASSSSSSGDTGGCGGGCLGPGQCYSKGDCSAEEFCLQDNCYPIGQCTPIANACPGAQGEACGCHGVLYKDACSAAEAGYSTHLSVTECSALPPGQFPCGSGFCDLMSQYCRQGTDGSLTCATPPPECAAELSCSCLAGQIDCGICWPTKGGGSLATECKS